MSVKKRVMRNGRLSENYYYRFKINGKEYKGSTFKSDYHEAKAYEESIKADIKNMLPESNSAEVLRQKSLVHFRDKITAQVQGSSVPVEEIWQLFRKKAPARMKTIPSEKIWKEKEGRWNDFIAFLKKEHSSCETMRDVTPAIAEEYVSLIKTSGKYQKTISYGDKSYLSKAVKLSASTINKYINDMTQVFRILSNEAGLLENPFEKVEPARGKAERRNVFELHELQKIQNYIKDNLKHPPVGKQDLEVFDIMYTVFVIGINTGLRKGDICLLKWQDVDFEKRAIETVTRKTGEKVFIPMTEILLNFLTHRRKYCKGQYVCSNLAKMYKTNQEGISYRFKKVLMDLGIETLKSQESRSRKISVKDIHSLRHTFCYLHGIQGTPLVVVQSMVGHMDKKMTEAYMMHQTEELKREAIERFSLKPFRYADQSPELSSIKRKIIGLVEKCNDMETLEKLLEFVRNPKSLESKECIEKISLTNKDPKENNKQSQGKGFMI